ncbi:MAG: prolyl oligopeptidase family serine peptidase [Rubrivivax sp.]
MTSPPPPARSTGNGPDDEDPWLWLEDVQGERALAWVRQRNAESEAKLRAAPGFDALREQLREVLDSRQQIPYVARRGEWFYNLWRDAANPRGLWRRTTLSEYRHAEPKWETVLDLDALGRAEGKSYVWGGAAVLGPEYRRALVSLSIGGADAHLVREFDLVEKRFVAPGSDAGAAPFVLPEAKSSVDWIDADSLYVATDFGPGSLTDSGYPRVIKRWRRGQPLAEATTVFEGEKGDVAAWVSVDDTPGFERTTFGRSIDFYNTKMWLLDKAAQARGAQPLPIDKPDDATLSFWRQRVLLELRSDWSVGGNAYGAGSRLVADAAAYLAGERRFDVLFAPTATRSLAAWTTTRSTVIVNVMDNVASRLEEWRPGNRKASAGRTANNSEANDRGAATSAWTKRDVAAPFPGTLSVGALHDPLLERGGAVDALAEQYLLNAADFLEPDSLQLGTTGSDRRETLKARPRFFDAQGMRAEQRFATARDGTRVPYFVVWPKGAAGENGAGEKNAGATSDRPALLYGYGGFEVSMQPSYSGTIGRAWTSRGGIYVLANIRGGGEYGPAWHQAALKEKR